ncbi:9393_t:CDS:10 [Entrophospora sp. SA101]|nr:13972_t:CDS:10 [Entrophospora sp. SA101]CAJ0765326.1 9393_t:CDS:10 [Entrophospora sp. SA101]CAJ0901633.1 448_t:CDS:10 [Entrophospora sp. SA101]
MPQPKLKKNSGLGRTIIKDRFKGHKPKDGDTALHTTDLNDGPSWTNLQSITHQKDLDEFLSTAQLAGTQFTAERLNIKVVTNHYENPFLLSSEKEKETLARHEANKERLVIPRRPKWDKSTTPEQLEHEEKESFLRWRQQDEFLLTPFERNIEVWRQLWRVIERSDLVVQIVDARNPLFFRSIDLEKYVKEIDEKKKNLLLINKADLLTKYFDSQGIRYIFFSAVLANEEIEKQIKTDEEEENDLKIFNIKNSENNKVKIVTTEDLISLLTAEVQDMEGLVGYPNVGKSSTINTLLGAKKVSVSSTPGKTKHFQTINLSQNLVLCDCPGLVFPNFATTNAEMICNGVLPIDQMREHTGPAALVSKRIPKDVLETMYGIKILTKPVEEGGSGIPTPEEFLIAYAGRLAARGLTKSGHGNYDESRAARYILKDYVKGKLPFCHPPPDSNISIEEFNMELHDPKLYLKKNNNKKTITSSNINDAKEEYEYDDGINDIIISGAKIKGKFSKTVNEFNRVKIYPINYDIDDNNNDSSRDVGRAVLTGKKHFKKGRKKH